MLTKQRIRNFYELFFNQRQFSVVNELIAEDYRQHNPGVKQGKVGLIEAFEAKFSSGEYFQLVVDRIVLEEDFAAVFLRSVNEQQETKAHVVDLYRIAQDQFVEHWDYFDRGK